MSVSIPDHILDQLTDIDMPRLGPTPDPLLTVTVGQHALPVHAFGCVVVGSGAAGLRAAVEMKRRGVDVAILSQSAWGGTSACSGSDKQTLHTANTADKGDNYRAMSQALRAGGAMDEDTAYVEAVGSGRAMASLQFMGLPLPQDPFGGTLRYQTDHDEVGRATSCGPRTSRLMVRVLAEEAVRLGITLFNHTTAVQILADGGVQGVLALRARTATAANPLGLALFRCRALVLAAGGPGELYRDSVFPGGCFGPLGMALEAGIDLVNLTESQFGIGTRREGFPWNLSGTYVQVMPHIYSVDAAGHEHHFLADYFRTTRELASNIFRKGYQWPFHAGRMLDFGSSMIDLAIWREGEQGRRVFMDFNRNPVCCADGRPFSVDRLDEDVDAYLRTAGAMQALPIDRLRHMNPLAIALYRRAKIDIATKPLEFAVNNQHMNGGIAVDVWGRSNLAGVYAVGETAGTHGVTRPGGAALNAGQVFGTRVAEHVAASGKARRAPADVPAGLGQAIARMTAVLRDTGELTVTAVRREVQARMSDHAGIICKADGVRQARDGARLLNARIARDGIVARRGAEILRAVQWQQMARLSEAVLTALDHYITQGGGSRGARAICDAAGTSVPMTPQGPLEAFRFRAENPADALTQIVVSLRGDTPVLRTRRNRALDAEARAFFERDWPAWLTGTIFDAKDGPGPSG